MHLLDAALKSLLPNHSLKKICFFGAVSLHCDPWVVSVRAPAGLWNPAHHSSERWVAGSLAAFPPQGCPCGDSSVPCPNLLSSVPSPASHPQCPSLHTVSVFCSHTHTLWTSVPPQSIPSLKSLISASPYPATAICPPSWSAQFLMPQGLFTLTEHATPWTPVLSPRPSHLSLHLTQSSVISATLLCLSCPSLFCLNGKASLLNDPNCLSTPDLVMLNSHNMAGRVHCKYMTTLLHWTLNTPTILPCFFGQWDLPFLPVTIITLSLLAIGADALPWAGDLTYCFTHRQVQTEALCCLTPGI